MFQGITSLCVILISSFGWVSTQTCVSPTNSCDCFVDEDGRKIINCRYRNLDQIPGFIETNTVYDAIIFQTTEETGQCQYNCNNITTLKANSFDNLRVRKIDLRNNPISVVSADAFNNQGHYLEELLLEGNGQVDPPYAALAVLENLTTLHLENFVSSTIQLPKAILPLPKLQSLTIIKWTNLQTLDKDVFSIMTNLSSLNLQNLPSLKILPSSTIQMFWNLTSVVIMDTGLQYIDSEIFSPRQSLLEVSIRHNYHLSGISDQAFSSVSDTVVYLDLVENRLKNLDFLSNTNWTNLNQLNIGYNLDLRTLENGVFSTMPRLASLQCQGIGLTYINSTMFENLTQLTFIDLSYNNIQTVAPWTFQNSPKLSTVLLNHQTTNGRKMTLQRNALAGLENSLEALHLSGNKLYLPEIWEEINGLANLKQLELESVGINYIPNFVFTNNTKLESINLANNNITVISQSTFYGPRHGLKFIDLQNNKITTVDSCVLNDLTAEPTLYLTGNPLHCDCNLVWLYDWVKADQNTHPERVYTVGTCAAPPSLAYKYFSEFTRAELCPGNVLPSKCLDLYGTTSPPTTDFYYNSTTQVTTDHAISTDNNTHPEIVIG